MQQKYATASEELKALSEEKLVADEACSRLWQEASKLEERSVLASSELEVRKKRPLPLLLLVVPVAAAGAADVDPAGAIKGGTAERVVVVGGVVES